MKSIIDRIFSIKALLSLMLVFAASGAWAGFKMTNPVTGKEETYTYKFVGTTHIWNGTQYWQNSEGANPSAVPGVTNSNLWDPILFDASVNSINITAGLSVEGWNLRMGLYNGAKVKLNNLQKLQGNNTPMWITVDGTSQCTIGHMANAKLVNSLPLSLYSAKTGGIAWSEALSDSSNGNGSSMPFHYYLTGTGSVAFNAGISVTGNGAHVIKQADVTLTGTSQVSSKTLVSFTSSTKTFTADAAIKVYDTDGTTLKKLVGVTAVRQSGATIENTVSQLTTANAVGSCEIVQCTDGIVLYYVDGAPSAVTGYKPSININFTHNGGNLTTTADVGLAPYAVPGTVWNNYAVPANGATSTQTSVYSIDATGTKSLVSGATVSISGTRGSHTCSSLTAASDLRHGYIDEKATAEQNTPTVVVSDIPFDHYTVVVYTAADTENATFNYITVNGTNYTYVNEKLATGTSAWGNAGAANSANALAEGVNVLVSPVTSGSTATIVGHKASNTCRGNIAAVQIVEIGENDLVIELDGDKTHTFEEAKTYDTVYVTGSGTLTFAGTASTATTLDIFGSAAVNMNGSTLTPSAVTGTGTVVYDGAQPSTTVGFDDSANWHGTVWVKNIGSNGESSKVSTVLGTDTATATGNVLKDWGNENSSVKFTNVRGWTGTAVCPWTLILEDDSTNYAWYNNNGYAARSTTFAALKGSGTFYDKSVDNKPCRQKITFTDGSQFTGALYAEGKRVGLGGENTRGDAADNNGTIEVVSGATATVASGKTWTAGTGSILVTGTLYANGTLAGTSTTRAVRGSGTVVFTGSAPSPTGDAWWKNSAWTGTVWIKSHAIVALDTNLYGNEGSTLKFTGVTGYFAQNHVNTVPIELENNGSTAAFNYNNGWGGELLTFSELKGTGTLQTSSAGDGGTIWVKKWDAFTGVMNLGKKQVVMGGSEPAHDNVNRDGKLVIAEGAVVTNLHATTAWTAGAGIEVNGTFAASDRSAWADGTAMTVNSTGILNMYGSGINDTSKSFANVTGTGTIWYSQTSASDDAKWSALPSSSANMFANTLSVSNDNSVAGVIITMNGASDVVTTNANISGTGYFRSDWDEGAYRGFLALQSKNTTWSGTFGSSSRIKKFIVAGVDGATDRTLTLAGTQSSTIPLTVESLGSVNITGTYLGATTVSGEIGGTGTLTGDLTFNAGATFKAFASDTDGLAVSGTVTYPAEGKVTVDVSALEQTGTKVLMTASGLDVSKFALASGQSGKLSVDGNALKVSFSTYVASYGGKDYEMIQEAIDAAVADSHTYEDVTILDPAATCPNEYYIDNGTLKKKPASITVGENVYYYTTIQAAVQDALPAPYGSHSNYDYLTIYESNTAVAMMDYTLKLATAPGVTGVTVSLPVSFTTTEYAVSSVSGDTYTTYSVSVNPKTYRWKNAAAGTLWTTASNWEFQDNETWTSAQRYPGDGTTGDTVVVAADTSIQLGNAVTLASLQVTDGTLALAIPSQGTATTLTASEITLGANATISLTGVTLSPTPTSGVEGYTVVEATNNGTTTYSLTEQITVDDAEVGYMDNATAVVTNTTAAVTVPKSATAVALSFSTGSEITLTSTTTLTTDKVTVYATDENGQKTSTDISSAFKVTAGENGTYIIELDDEKVTPEVAGATPMAFTSTAPTFAIEAVPGLWYAVEVADTIAGLDNPSYGTPVQAESATVNPVAPTFEGTVKYYRIGVAPSRAALVTPPAQE